MLEAQVDKTMKAATEAFTTFRRLSGKERGTFLRMIGEEIKNLGDELIHTVATESFLPEGRIRGELARTVGQLNKFAELVEEGSWREATIDIENPAREPLPKPDLRRLLVPLGPVVVFGAGNFPLAFSTAGGDTASALAGGNPVVVKGHPAHPKTGELVAKAISSAVKKSDLHPSTFAMIQDANYEAGKLLVEHHATKAVAFTGSMRGGMALVQLAAKRKEPIPVFAEMGSINPFVILPEKLEKEPSETATKLIASVNLGAGQFCTNPGLVITTRTKGFKTFIKEITRQIQASASNHMFSESVLRNYKLNAQKMFEQTEISIIARGESTDNKLATPAIATVSAADFIRKPELHEEVFGPFSLLVVCENFSEITNVVKCLKGQLTATIHATESELLENGELVENLLEKCGRLLLNGVPTGVEVSAAMQHGGPFPATSDSRFTSVGVNAIKRFVRPVCYQDFPEHLLPMELQNTNPLNIWRTVDNKWTKEAIN